MKPKALILQAHGSNRDHDVAEALALAGADAQLAPLNDLRTGKKRFADYQMLVVPGGFSYADALGAGKLLALDLNSYFNEEIYAFVDSGKPVIGICNGFQALVKSGMLPGNSVIARRSEATTKQSSTHEEIASGYRPRNDGATLTFNAEGHFECRWVILMPASQTCIWTKGMDEQIICPIAHGEGNFQTSDPSLVNTLVSQDQVALTYIYADGTPANGDYPANPNGSVLDIAGICNPRGNVLGLMPHPENHIHPYQHPQWTRDVKGNSGLALFENGVRYARDFA
ncbi:MAG TPA: phosphoribosylformylglycinamidine synthase I [Anaerolineales bacterium]|nr:phosphoribosylformylglycinamidine synthase I [Anaerolineales bacterium]